MYHTHDYVDDSLKSTMKLNVGNKPAFAEITIPIAGPLQSHAGFAWATVGTNPTVRSNNPWFKSHSGLGNRQSGLAHSNPAWAQRGLAIWVFVTGHELSVYIHAGWWRMSAKFVRVYDLL